MDECEDLDFSFSCNKCTYTTKSIMEIKVHAMEHKKEANQVENDKGSSRNDTTSETFQNDQADDGMVDIPVGSLNAAENTDDAEKEEEKKIGNKTKDTTDSSVGPARQSYAQVDSSTQSDPSAASTGEYQEHDETDRNNEVVKVSFSNDGINASNLSVETIGDSLMVDMGTQMSPMPAVAPVAKSPRGKGAAKRKAKVPVRELVEEPEEFEEETTEDEEMDVEDEDYQPPVTKQALDDFKDSSTRKKGRRPLTRSKLKVLKKKKKMTTPGAVVAEVVKQKYKCANCDFDCTSKPDLSNHMKDVHMIEIKIEELSDGEQFVESDNENKLVEGMSPPKRKSLDSSAPDDRYTCTICNEYKCKFKKDLARHKQEAHNIASPEYKYVSRVAKDRYKCMQCNYTCKFQRQLRGHRRRVHPRPKPVSTKSGNKLLNTSSKVVVPLDRYKCGECDFSCKFKGVLRAHRIKEHKKERVTKKAGKIRDLECEYCGKIIRGTQHHLVRHIKTHTGEKPWECDVCGAVFAEKGRLNVHKPIHNEARPWLCEECGKSFKRAINLRMHRKIHVEVKPYQCELCAYRCTRHDTLNLHMKRKHLKLRRVLCTVCGRKFFSEKECQAHTARKHLPRPTPFQCTLCPAAFPFAYNLRAHMKKHPEHKPYKCEYCGFESRSKASLKDHERQHTGEKEKKCDLCDYATTTSSNLYKHRKRQHGIIGMPAKQVKGRGRPPRANALLAAQAAATASRGSESATSAASSEPPVAHQHLPIHSMQPVTLRISAEDLVTQRPHHSKEERVEESIEDSTEVVPIPQQVALQVQHVYKRPTTTVMYTQRDKIIGSVITDALAEAHNVVQTHSDIYASQIIPTSLPTSSIATSVLPSSSSLQPVTVTHSGSTFTMAHTAGLPQGAVVNLPEGMITAAGIPVTAQGLPVTAQGLHVPVTVAMQNLQSQGPTAMFSSMMNMHY